MKRWLTTPLLLSSLIACSLDVVAEGYADRQNEQHPVLILKEHKKSQTSSPYAGALKSNPRHKFVNINNLKYSAGEMRKAHPSLSAHKLKRLVFDNH